MRRFLCFLLILSCIAGMIGCSQKEDIPENSVTVYFKREKPTYGTADGVIATSYLDADEYRENYSYLLDKYFRTSPSEGFVSPFPEGLTAQITLNDRIADLSGIDLTIALICISETVMSISGCQEVIIRAATKLLDGQKFVTLNRDSYLLLDNSGEYQN